MIKFIHLDLHTEYSIVDSTIRIGELIDHCLAQDMPAVALTDQNNLFAAIKFYQAALAAGIKPIIGVSLWLYDEGVAQPEFYRLTILAKNSTGYRNMLQLVSRSYLEGQSLARPSLRRQWLEELAAGLIILSGAKDGDLGKALLQREVARVNYLTNFWQRVFPEHYYLAICRTGRKDEEEYLTLAHELAVKTGLPLVATNAVRFLRPEDFEAHEARVCINSGQVLSDPRRPLLYSTEQYLKSAAEMAELFRDLPESLVNTGEIAQRCSVEIELDRTRLPIYSVPTGGTAESYFMQQSREGLARRVAGIPDESARESYQQRLEYEIAIINQMGFASYFLIVADFINWSKKNSIPVGPGRGSGAGSLVAYALDITDIDPLKHELLFERFLNPERVTLPDFDVDFCMEGRDRVIEYVIERYGRDRVAQIITYGTMAARAVVRDVGRVLGYPYGFTDKIAKLIPFALGMTLAQALREEELLQQRYNSEEEVKTLLDLARKLEGLVRNAGTHAGGVVIAPAALTDFTPLYRESNTEGIITQFDKDDIERVGLVKFDFLGLRTLTIIDWTLKTINQNRHRLHQEPLNLSQLPLDDPATYQLLQSGKTAALFQLESRISRDLIKRFRPDCFDDIVALIAIIRPGVLQSGMIDELVERKQGKAKITYLHPKLEPILRSTYGVAIYQEQVMQMAQSLAGYSLGSADLLRRAMGKKKPAEMVKQRAVFIEGAVANGVERTLASTIFDYMEKFASYGFNKSHSAAYAILSYQTAWLKTHYSGEFMAAVLSSDMDNTEKVVAFLHECRTLDLTIVAPDINRSSYHFSVGKDSREIIYGLGAIKGVGMSVATAIVTEREHHGSFSSVFDLCTRIADGKLNKRALEALICAGALDQIGPERGQQFANVEAMLKVVTQWQYQLTTGQRDLFATLPQEETNTSFVYLSAPEWSAEQRLRREKEVLGFYLRGHPIVRYGGELRHFAPARLAELGISLGKNTRVAGFITALKFITAKTGRRMAMLSLEDETGQVDVTLFDEVFTKARETLQKDSLIIVEGEVLVDGFTDGYGYRVRGNRVLTLVEARANYTRGLLLGVGDAMPNLSQLAEILEKYSGGTCPIFIEYHSSLGSAKFRLGDGWKVVPSDALLEDLKSSFSWIEVNFVY